MMIAAGAIALASPAYADEHVLARDNSEVACTVSKSGLTRISLKDDRFASVSKLTTGNETEDFTVVNEPTRGDIYLSVPDGFTRPRVSFFGTTAKGYVYKFACRLGPDDAQQVFVENKDILADSTREAAGTGPSLQEASASLVQAMYRSAPLAGFDMVPTTTDPVMVGMLKVQMVAEYRGSALAGRVLRIENRGRDAVTLREGNGAFQAPLATISDNGNGGLNHAPSLGNVGLRALGGGASEAGKDLSKYLIERAEQYQPVIEMPTGITVEIVFLDGVFIQN